MPTNVDLDGMALFVRIVEAGSISAAGRALGLPKATVSRRLVQLEASIGTLLLARSTRALSVTDAGRRFFERVQPIVHEAQAAHAEIMSASSEPSGILRITAPIIFGEVVVAPGLMQFLQRYPRIQADLHFSDARVNIVAEGFDLAIRMGEIEDSDLIGRRLTEVTMGLVASPSYLKIHGVPERAQDLRNHTAILTQKKFDHWIIGAETVRLRWRMSTGSMVVTRNAVRDGLGIARVPEFFVARDLAEGTLQRVLPRFDVPGFSVTALYPRSAVPSLALRTLLDALPEWCVV
jgi:DNA-binding transcriptional LysR family regulator